MSHQQPARHHDSISPPEGSSGPPDALPHEKVSQEHLAAVWAQRARVLAQPVVAQTTGKTIQLLAFLLAGQRYGIEVAYVREIYPVEQITAVPRAPDFVVGLFSARGRLISIIDLHAFLGLPKVMPGEKSKLIVVATADLEIALIVDDVSDIALTLQEEVEPATSAHMTNMAEFVQGIAPGAIAILNLPALLSNKGLIISEQVL
jgi:purine-binding chemotaxis protein CheW